MRTRLFALGFLAAILALAAANIPAEAEGKRAQTRIIVKKRSYLDAGTVVKPGTARYHDYAFPPESRFSSYGFQEGSWPAGAGRWPLPRVFELPGF
jgi:hypothetical protein